MLGYKPREFASQMNLNLNNGWAIVRTFVDMVMREDDGKYVLVKGEAETTLGDALPAGPVALVLGAEGPGMRHNIASHCDALARLPISDAVESLNVSNAAAVALYAIAARSG